MTAPEDGKPPASAGPAGGQPPARTANDRRAWQSAADVLGPAMRALIASVRRNAERVIASGQGQAVADDEAVHDFRVALRRLRTLLRPARWVYGKKRLRPIARGLRAFAQATGALRDDEVLRETLLGLALEGDARSAVEAWVGARANQEKAARAHVVERLRRDRSASRGLGPATRGTSEALRLEPHLTRLEMQILGGNAKRRYAEALARRAIDDALRGVRALAASDPSVAAAMHALRIRWKRLRYSAETFAPLFGERLERIAKSAARMQRRLGELHDADEALARVAQAQSMDPTHRAAVLEALGRERGRIAHKLSIELPNELSAITEQWPPTAAAL